MTIESKLGYYFADELAVTIEGAKLLNTEVYYDNTIAYISYDVNSAKATYHNIQGDGNNWLKGSNTSSDFTFKRTVNDDKTFGKFSGVKVDGKTIDSSNYDAIEGSVIVKLKPAYLETLSVGTHTLTAMFTDGNEVSVKFNVIRKTQIVRTYRIPKTGIE